MKKILSGILISIFILMLIGGVSYLVFSIKPKNLNSKKELVRNVGEEVPSISDFFEEPVENGTIEFLQEKERFELVKLNKAGSFEVKIQTGKKEYFSKLTVLDNDSPILKLKDLTLTAEEKYLPISFVESCTDNSKEDCLLSFKEENMGSFKDVGEYEVEIIARDSSGNETQAKAKLNLTKKNSSSSSNQPTPPKKQIIKYTEEKSTKDKYQFGTKISTITTIGYNVFNDGSLEKVSEKTDTIYDYSGYNATTDTYRNYNDDDILLPSDQTDIKKIIEKIATYRATNGIISTSNENLILSTMVRALEISWSNKFSSTRPNGTSWKTILSELEVPYTKAEEILLQETDLETVYNTLISTKAYQEKLLNNAYTNFWIWKSTVDNKSYWVLILTD